jgi:hypothetical protein
MFFTISEAAREACLRLTELIEAIDDGELETIEGPDGEVLINGDELAEFVQKRRSVEIEDEDEDEDEDEENAQE